MGRISVPIGTIFMSGRLYIYEEDAPSVDVTSVYFNIHSRLRRIYKIWRYFEK